MRLIIKWGIPYHLSEIYIDKRGEDIEGFKGDTEK